MLINKKELGKIASTFLRIFDQEKIFALEDIQARIGSGIVLDGGRDKILFSEGASNFETNAFIVDYARVDTGIVPIELRFNPTLEYSSIAIRCKKRLKGYTPHLIDDFENIIQSKLLNPQDNLGREELKLLRLMKY